MARNRSYFGSYATFLKLTLILGYQRSLKQVCNFLRFELNYKSYQQQIYNCSSQSLNFIAMPCLYKMEIKESPIDGKGFFAMEDIPKGAVYWVWEDLNGPIPVKGYDVKENRIYTQSELQAVQDEERLKHILHGGFYYADANLFVELRDGTEFTNHSEDWNSQIIYDQGKDYKKMTCVARKEIKAGDQITGYYGNYMSTQAEWVDSLMRKHLPFRKAIETKIKNQGNKAEHWRID